MKRVQKIETAVEPTFQKHFVEGSSFPNESSTHPELFKFKNIPNVNFNQKGREDQLGREYFCPKPSNEKTGYSIL